MKRLIIIAMLIRFTTHCLISEEFFTSLIGIEQYTKLFAEGEVTSVFKKDGNLSLLPGAVNRAELMSEIALIKPVIGVEILLMYKEAGRNFTNPQELLAIYNQLHAISSLSGIDYYSDSRKRMHTFFYKAYVIENSVKKVKVNDKKAVTIQAADTLYAFMDDSSFGKYTGEVQYTFPGDHFTMKITNLVPIYYLLIPVVEPGNLKMYLAVYPHQDTILFYGFTCVNTPDAFNLAESRSASFYNRIKAMVAWFTANIKKTN